MKCLRMYSSISNGFINLLIDIIQYRIQVKIDGIDPDIKDFGLTLNMDVYPSTKVHELRALVNNKMNFDS